MNMVFIADTFIPRGGASKIGLDLIRKLSRSNVSISVITGEPPPPELNVRGRVISLDRKRLQDADFLTNTFRGLNNADAGSKVGQYILEFDTPDTVYVVNSWFQILSPSIFRALSRVAPRVMVYAHDFYLACPNGAYFDFSHDEPCDRTPLSVSCVFTQCDKRSYLHKVWRSAVGEMRRLNWDISSNGSRVIAVHEGMVDYLTKAGIPEKAINVVRNPCQPFTEDRVEAERNQEVLYVGALTPQKGFDVLMDALRERRWRVNIFGAGGLTAPPLPQFSSNGFQPHEVIHHAAKRARCLILPSRQRETFGLSAVEAFGSGLPTVVSAQALISQDVQKHNCGLVVPSVTKSDLLAAIDRLFSSDKLVEDLSYNCRKAFGLISPSYDAWAAKIVDLGRGMISA